MKRILLSISSTEAIVTVARGRRITPCQRFASDASGWQAFGLWLADHRLPVAIIVDAVEEDYRSEVLPHTRGGTRAQLIERKIKQHYRNTPYTTAIWQGRENDGRRDDRFLFAAFTNPELLEPWLEELARQRVPVSGVYLTPLVSRALVVLLGAGDKPVLLVSQRRTGLRQSFFDRGELKLSRLTSIDVSQPRAGYAQEILKTRAYLTSLRLIPRDSQLKVLLLDSDGSLGELVRALEQDPGVALERVGPAALAKAVSVEPTALSACPEALHFLASLRGRLVGSLAPLNLLLPFRIDRARRAIFVLAAGIFALSSILAIVQLRERSQLDSETRALAQAIRVQQNLYAAAARGFPAAPAPADVLQNAVQLSTIVQNQVRTPALALSVAGLALERNPQIYVKRMQWSASKAARQDAPNAAPSAETFEIEAEIRPFDGDFRAALAKVERFATDLSKDQRTARVRIIESPLDVSSAANLSGSAAMGGQTAVPARFRLVFDLQGR